MNYKPVTCVWEVTMGCNMRCKHCGSSCSEALPDELTTEEALRICDQIGNMGLLWLTLSGGEPLTRKDLPLLIDKLHKRGISVNVITNGWLLNEAMADSLLKSGIATVAISIDGTPEIHDQIRCPGAFEHARLAFQYLKARGIQTGAITTISKQNIDHLESLKEELITIGVETWQVQLGLPMGNLKERPDWVLEPSQVNDVIDFCHRTALEGRIRIFPADCIGYYTQKEMEIKKISYRTDVISMWDGCNAGTRGFGILQNGDILGCTSIRSREYIEGSLRERTLREIWEDENSFTWRRGLKKEQLSGTCSTCTYGSKCLGGCPNTRLTMEGSIYAENKYCAYHLELKRIKTQYEGQTDGETLYQAAEELIRQEQYQEASFALERAAELLPDYIKIYLAKGYCDYMCGNYKLCLEANEKALKLNPADAYALKGYAIAQHKLGNEGEGLRSIQRAAAIGKSLYEDILNDMMALGIE